MPVAVHVDGLEWQRDKWHGAGRAYYRWAEQSAVRNADALIADAKGIADYYASEFGASTRQIAYGAPVQLRPVFDRLERARPHAGRATTSWSLASSPRTTST